MTDLAKLLEKLFNPVKILDDPIVFKLLESQGKIICEQIALGNNINAIRNIILPKIKKV